MSNIDHFTEKFQSKTFEELNQIVQNPDNYQSDAIQAARQLLNERGQDEIKEQTKKDPVETIDPEEHNYHIPVVPRTFRFIHSVIDTILIYFLTAFSMQVVRIGDMGFTLWFGNTGIVVDSGNLYLVFFLYYFFTELILHKSFGKYLTKSVVVDEFGQYLSLSQTLIRTLCRLIPFEPLSCLASPSIGWHDRFSKSYVIMQSDMESLRSQENPHADSRHLISDDMIS